MVVFIDKQMADGSPHIKIIYSLNLLSPIHLFDTMGGKSKSGYMKMGDNDSGPILFFRKVRLKEKIGRQPVPDNNICSEILYKYLTLL